MNLVNFPDLKGDFQAVNVDLVIHLCQLANTAPVTVIVMSNYDAVLTPGTPAMIDEALRQGDESPRPWDASVEAFHENFQRQLDHQLRALGEP